MKHTWNNSMNVQIVVKSLSVEKRLHLNLWCLSKCDFDEQNLAIEEGKKNFVKIHFWNVFILDICFWSVQNVSLVNEKITFINKTKTKYSNKSISKHTTNQKLLLKRNRDEWMLVFRLYLFSKFWLIYVTFHLNDVVC